MRIFFILFLLLVSASTRAAEPQLLLIVSQRNAETIAEAVAQFHRHNPDIGITARTDSQWLASSPSTKQTLLGNSQVLVGIGLYGAIVSELKHDLQQTAPATLLIFSSDHRLVALSRYQQRRQFSDQHQLTTLAALRPDDQFQTWLTALMKQYPQQASWLTARGYWQAGGVENTRRLFTWLASPWQSSLAVEPPQAQPRLSWWYQQHHSEQLPNIADDKPVVMLLDHIGGSGPSDRQVFEQLCQQIENGHTLHCLVGLAAWGDASVQAIKALSTIQNRLAAIVMLQDFVIGGGQGREQVTEQLVKLNVPVLKAIKLRDRTAEQWQLSADGINADKVYYQVAMPEIQGVSQPIIVATAGVVRQDPLSGIEIQPIEPELEGMTTISQRVQRWTALQTKPNHDKRVAIVYYNHPPGRHNIGADNLDVPASLWQILNRLKQAGYQVDNLPNSQQALLDDIQKRGVNLPNDRHALETMTHDIPTMSPEQYQAYFSTLPNAVQDEMRYGPFGRLQAQLRAALDAKLPQQAQDLITNTMEEMLHLVEGVDHPARARAISLLNQLKETYLGEIHHVTPDGWQHAMQIIKALQQTGIEGLGGWGEIPGNVMVYRDQLLLPSLQYGNVMISPQPPRGWEVNPELLHANLAFPPTHQYLAYYHYLKDVFKADVIVHVGRHSTYEFLPHRSVGLAGDDYSRIIAGDIPGIYPYIVDGVGEGIQAKRRGLAVMVDHLTPPLESTPLYDDLLQLRQLVESFEANHDSRNQTLKNQLIKQIRAKVDALDLKQELAQSMSAELAVMGIGFEQVNDDMLVHEIGHYLTNLQENFMPYGLHIFGKDWQPSAIDMMVNSMAAKTEHQRQQWQTLLQSSPSQEMTALLNGLNGRFIAPGKGNDPIRSPESLPTGRNFYALDNSLIPSRIAWQLGQQMARTARENNPIEHKKREAQILWASDVVRDEGVMIAFALDMLGLEPVWNSRGLVKGLKRQSLPDGRVRRDMVFTTSGLFRDLYAQQMHLLDNAVLLALDASADVIVADYPALTETLDMALGQLGALRQGGHEPLTQNLVAAHWVEDSRALLAQGLQPKQVALQASLRIFGDAPGSYGAGVNRLAERSGAWEKRQQLADVYLRRLGHGFTSDHYGVSAENTFRHLLSSVENTYFGRSSNLYGLIDNNDAFDYLGGLSLAVETLSGQAPNNFVINHANPEKVTTEPLAIALKQELRGRFLNPEWLQGLMKHGYAGARTMGSEFLEYLWGWQVTNPTLVGDWAWQEVKDVYIDDRYQLGLDDFLEQGHNVHVKSNMLAIMLVAINKGFWNADQATKEQLANQFAQLVIEHGLPGSGHTTPDHPMMPWIKQLISEDKRQAFSKVLQQAQMDTPQRQEIHSLKQVTIEQPDTQTNTATQSDSDSAQPNHSWLMVLSAVLVGLLLISLAALGYRQHRRTLQELKGQQS